MPKIMSMKRKIGGRVFHMEYASVHKRDAEREADKYRGRGYNVRILEGAGLRGYPRTWAVFVSRSKRKR